jgi:hypothetical protein
VDHLVGEEQANARKQEQVHAPSETARDQTETHEKHEKDENLRHPRLPTNAPLREWD